MIKIADVARCLEKLAPLQLALDWDNVGLQLGGEEDPVSAVLVTLTVTEEVAAKAIAEGAELIVSHHPLIFSPLRSIRTDQPSGSLLARLVRENIALYVSHTNLDRAPFGLNHWLASRLHLDEVRVLMPGSADEESGLGRVGKIKKTSLASLRGRLAKCWGAAVRMVGDPERLISTAAVVSGSGGGFIKAAHASGADVLITGDISYHDAIDAEAMGLAVIDAGHFATEQIMVAEVAAYLRKNLPGGVEIIEDSGADPFRF